METRPTRPQHFLPRHATAEQRRTTRPGTSGQPPSRSTVLESVQNAADQARCLAAALTGVPRPYPALPWFWSCQADLRLQIAGLSTGHDHTVVRGEPDKGFSVFCFRDGSLVAVESVIRAPDHMAARRLLAAGGRVTPENATDPGAACAVTWKAYGCEHHLPCRGAGLRAQGLRDRRDGPQRRRRVLVVEVGREAVENGCRTARLRRDGGTGRGRL
ncbi:oxidoreductase C-terminal domain-containing protein [Streptomyces acidicola]|uniref:oxidoreductase C-terminal domain-containing protein n=1 Tax=Streptomyces acidicola TaxID=2596892 RepID=UPI00344601C1